MDADSDSEVWKDILANHPVSQRPFDYCIAGKRLLKNWLYGYL